MPSRKKAALVLLYATGLRISNLLLLKLHNIDDLFNKGSTIIPLIKRGADKHTIALSKKGKQVLKQFHSNFFCLMKDKNREDFLFTTQANLQKPINRSSFDQEINQILAAFFQKHIRTHTFRASIITDLLKETRIDIVKEVIGHKDIKTTLQYKRGPGRISKYFEKFGPRKRKTNNCVIRNIKYAGNNKIYYLENDLFSK